MIVELWLHIKNTVSSMQNACKVIHRSQHANRLSPWVKNQSQKDPAQITFIGTVFAHGTGASHKEVKMRVGVKALCIFA